MRNSYATGAVTNSNPFEVEGGTGGLVGLNTGLISTSYATGAVNGFYAVGVTFVGLNDGTLLDGQRRSCRTATATGAVFAQVPPACPR